MDTTNRRLAFAHVLAEVPPESLSLKQRQTVLGRGLRDREEAVRKAAKKLVAKWAEYLEKNGKNGEGLIEAFAALFDVHNDEGREVVEKAFEGLFDMRPDLVEGLGLDGKSSDPNDSPFRAMLTGFQHRRELLLDSYAGYRVHGSHLSRLFEGARITHAVRRRTRGDGARVLPPICLDSLRRQSRGRGAR